MNSLTDTGRKDAIEQIEAALAMLIEGIRTRNADMASDPYLKTDEYVLFDFMPPFVDKGWKFLHKKNQDYLELTEGVTSWYFTDKHIEVDQNMAYFRGIAHIDGKYKDGRSIKISFRDTKIFKNINGRWVIVHEHVSMPHEAVGLHPPE